MFDDVTFPNDGIMFLSPPFPPHVDITFLWADIMFPCGNAHGCSGNVVILCVHARQHDVLTTSSPHGHLLDGEAM
jgi:hypothetical protein